MTKSDSPDELPERTPWVPEVELRRIIDASAADAGLLDDLADVRGDQLGDD